VVVSSAIAPENPERLAARDAGLVELHRADLLGELTRAKPTLAVTGTHGKTTTSSMIVHALRGAGLTRATSWEATSVPRARTPAGGA
jgi:UDP-N-acetylmuramate--alanine ligase